MTAMIRPRRRQELLPAALEAFCFPSLIGWNRRRGDSASGDRLAQPDRGRAESPEQKNAAFRMVTENRAGKLFLISAVTAWRTDPCRRRIPDRSRCREPFPTESRRERRCRDRRPRDHKHNRIHRIHTCPSCLLLLRFLLCQAFAAALSPRARAICKPSSKHCFRSSSVGTYLTFNPSVTSSAFISVR